MGWQLAPATTFTKQKLSFSTLNIKEPGTIFIYLSYDNDSNNWVYFDDLKVTHTKSNILQYNEYYPFGLQTASSWTREGSSNSYLYNEGSELNQNSGWYETFFRGYDPTLGRFHQVDPLANVSSSHTPYNYAYNDPVFFNDPNGDYVEPTLRSDKPVTYDWTSVMIAGGMDGFSNVVSQIYGGSPIPGGGSFGGNSIGNFINSAMSSQYGGSWSNGEAHLFTSYQEALKAGSVYNDEHNSWQYTTRNTKTYQPKVGKYLYRWRNGKPKYIGVNTVAQQEGISITVTDNIVGSAWVKGYPDPVSDGNGSLVFYEVPTYEMIVSGVDNKGNPSSKTFSVIRFGVQHTGTSQPFMTGLTNAGTYDGTWGTMRSGMEGLHLEGASNGGVYIHAGPINNTYLVGAIKCIELCGPGSWTGFNTYINSLGGRSVPTIITLEAAAMPPLVQKGTYKP
jgi:RHS repeat-associated protein